MANEDAPPIRDWRVVQAMGRVPREAFVPEEIREQAGLDRPLPIGHGQTISQPYVVAFMTDALGVEPGMKVLEVGTGSGFQTAVLAELGADVFTVEILPQLAAQARARLEALGYLRIHFRLGDGSLGWPEHAPFDRIIVTAAPAFLPPALVTQLRPGGRMILPVGTDAQEVQKVERHSDGSVTVSKLLPVRFVPMTGRVSS